MAIKAIIFDKDGTLIDFDAFWISVSVNAINILFEKLGVSDVPLDEMLLAIGVVNGASDIDGLLCKGTYEEIALAFGDVLKKYGYTVPRELLISTVLDAYNRSSSKGQVKGTCEDVKGVLTRLKDMGIKLAVVTIDSPEITERCLKALGVYDCFDKIYTDDGVHPTKPDPYCVMDFCAYCGVLLNQTVMIGDTMTDVRFAQNAGITAVSLARDEKAKKQLSPYADAVIDSISDIFDCIFD